jgi:hypothetical protein
VGNFPAWYSPALKKALKEKFKFLRKFRVYGNRSDEQSFKILRDRCKALEKDCYRAYINTVEDSLKDNPKMFWSFIKSKSSSNDLPSSMKYGDNVLNTGQSICDTFSAYFHSNFLANSSSLTIPCSLSSVPSVTDINNIVIDIEEVIKVLSTLDPSKSAGPDFLPALFLKNCAKTVATPISILFKKSLAQNTVPSIWKRAFVTPVYKKGSKVNVTNYRPISKLCIVSKVFEKIVYKQLYAALQQSFGPSQHGFLRGRSVASNLVLLNEHLTVAMDRGYQVDVIYTDYSKAFDRIQHELLIQKLQMIGVGGDLLRWLSSYIDNRSQAVVVKNYISGWLTAPSGIPQGSLLGPLLFAVFINDIEKCFKTSQLLCFADDMKILASISTTDDTRLLQEDLVRLDNYCLRNHLDLNASKCSVVTYSRKRNLVLVDYMLSNVVLKRETVIRDLGVLHDHKLVFDSHINNIISKASRALGFIMRSSRDFRHAKTLKILYCSLVRSHLEYASQVWSPRYSTYISRIEGIQRRFMKFLCYRTKERYDSSRHDELCKKHHILPLHIRRDIADLVFLSKIATGVIDCPELLSKITLRTTPKPLRFNPLLCIPPASSNFRQNSFLWRASNKFNVLSKQVNIDLFNTSEASIRRIVSSLFFCNSCE